MFVRIAQLSDVAAIAAIHVASWHAAYRGLVPEELLQNVTVERRTPVWAATLTQGASSGYVYEEGHHILGFVSFGPGRDPDVDRGQVGEVYTIYLEPPAWNKGHGAALLQAALAALRNQGFAAVVLWVLHNNRRAIRFYERAEFQPDGATKVETHLDGIELKELRYRRSLSSRTL